jgi:uncharacterized protein (DUF2249 family)
MEREFVSHGLEATPEQASDLLALGASAGPILDLRELEAPEPMQRILEAAAKLAPGGALLARTPCYPRPLLAQLAGRSLGFAAAEEPDGTGLVYVRRPA